MRRFVRFAPWTVPLLACVAAFAARALGEESGAAPAHLLDARVSRVDGSLPRVVLTTDRAVEFLTVELGQEDGYEIHLLGTDASALPAPAAVQDELVRSLTLRPGPQGVVARVTLAARRAGRAYRMEKPDRIVLDLPLESADAGVSLAEPATTDAGIAMPPADAQPAETPHADTKSATAPADTKHAETKPADAKHAAKPADAKHADAKHTEAKPADTKPTANSPEIDALSGWIGDIRAALESLSSSREGANRTAARRRLARLLEQRGLYEEAERVLLAAGAADAKQGGVADSLCVAELRRKRGDVEGALAICTALDASRVDAAGRVRLCAVLLDGDRPADVEPLLDPILDSLDPTLHARATSLLARSFWDRGEPAKALPLAEGIARDANTPKDLLPQNLLLQADCLWATGRAADARSLYERAATLPLGAEESSWTALQLGNLARREGRLADARKHYETAKERWPDTFYASQAEWFLQFDERLRALRDASGEKNRG